MKPTPHTIAISMGDPVGIGPELLASLAYDEALLQSHHLLCFGDARALAAGFAARGQAPRLTGAAHRPGWLSFVEVTSLDGLVFGQRPGECGTGRQQFTSSRHGGMLQGWTGAVRRASGGRSCPILTRLSPR